MLQRRAGHTLGRKKQGQREIQHLSDGTHRFFFPYTRDSGLSRGESRAPSAHNEAGSIMANL